MRATAVLATLVFSASAVLAAPAAIAANTASIDHKLASMDTPKNFHQDCDVHNVQCKAMNDAVYGTVNQGEGFLGKEVGHGATTGSNMLKTEGQSDLSSHVATDGAILQHDLQGRADSTLRVTGDKVAKTDGKVSSVKSRDEDAVTKAAEHMSKKIKADENGSNKSVKSDKKTIHDDLKARTHGHSQMNENTKEAGKQIYPEKLLANVGTTLDTQGKAVQNLGNGVTDITHDTNKEMQTLSHFNKDHGDETANPIIS